MLDSFTRVKKAQLLLGIDSGGVTGAAKQHNRQGSRQSE
jgi:hypothetical protein